MDASVSRDSGASTCLLLARKPLALPLARHVSLHDCCLILVTAGYTKVDQGGAVGKLCVSG